MKRIGAGSARPRRLDDDPAKPPDLAGIASLDQAAQGSRQVFADGAAQATAGQFEHAALDKVDEVMVDRDLADLVDDDRGVGEARERPVLGATSVVLPLPRNPVSRVVGRVSGVRHAINHSMTVNPARIVSRGRQGGKSRRQSASARRLPRPLHSLVCVSSMPAIRRAA